jgi:hypothetical protein
MRNAEISHRDTETQRRRESVMEGKRRSIHASPLFIPLSFSVSLWLCG